MDTKLPVFLGICQKASLRMEGLVQDLYGVTDYLAVHFFPQSLGDLILLMAFPKDITLVQEPVQIMLQNRKTDEKAYYDLSVKTGTIEEDYVQVNTAHVEKPYAQKPGTQQYVGSHVMISEDNPFKMVPVPCPNLFVPEPSDVDLYYNVGDQKYKLGIITCRCVPPPPMTESERNALMSRPT